MGRKWATREAESNLFDFGEAQRRRAEAAENLVKQLRQELEICKGARDSLRERVRVLEEERLIVVERYADNGELSHQEVVKASTGESIGVIALTGGKGEG